MIHQYLAALFCSTGLICWAVTAAYEENSQGSKFGIVYGLSMLGWIALGLYLDSSALVTIGSLQFISSISLNFYKHKNR